MVRHSVLQRLLLLLVYKCYSFEVKILDIKDFIIHCRTGILYLKYRVLLLLVYFCNEVNLRKSEHNCVAPVGSLSCDVSHSLLASTHLYMENSVSCINSVFRSLQNNYDLCSHKDRARKAMNRSTQDLKFYYTKHSTWKLHSLCIHVP